ncbi:MAG: transketolase [Syntrophales bacterium]|jgi:transketolase
MHVRQQADLKELENISRRVRKHILSLVHKTKGPHVGSAFSCVEILVGLYLRFLNASPANTSDPERDRFIFSKGHASPALYAILFELGFLNDDDLAGFAVNGGCLEQHPNKDNAKGIEVSTGSLGHGLAIAAGMALASRNDGLKHRVCVLISDGELNEGSTWEAVLFSAHHKLSNLLIVIDYNKMQALGTLELAPLKEKLEAFGWACEEIDGHSFPAIVGALNKVPFEVNKPSALIAHTTKGKGVSFMENSLYWHYSSPSDKEYALALDELSEKTF